MYTIIVYYCILLCCLLLLSSGVGECYALLLTVSPTVINLQHMNRLIETVHMYTPCTSISHTLPGTINGRHDSGRVLPMCPLFV